MNRKDETMMKVLWCEIVHRWLYWQETSRQPTASGAGYWPVYTCKKCESIVNNLFGKPVYK